MRFYNTSITERANRVFNFKGEQLQEVADAIVPTMEIMPNIRVLSSAVRTASGANNFFTSDDGKDTFVTSIWFDFAKDAACDVAAGSMTLSAITPEGTVTVARISILTTTAQYAGVWINFPGKGLKVSRNQQGAINFGANTFTLGNLVRSAVVYGYTDEVMKNT